MDACCPTCGHTELETRSLSIHDGPMCLVDAEEPMFPTRDGRAVETERVRARGTAHVGLALACPRCGAFDVVVPLPDEVVRELAATAWATVDERIARWVDPTRWRRAPIGLPPGDGPWILASVELVEDQGHGWAEASHAERVNAREEGDWAAVWDHHEDTGSVTEVLAVALP